MEQKQYAGPSTLQSIVNCCKNLFATHRSVDDLAEEVAYISSEDNETITDVELNDSNGGANIDVVASVGQTIVVKEVDENGKPTAWESADYQERTHWSKIETVDIIPVCDVTPVLNEDFGLNVATLAPFELTEGNTYSVVFDGEQYTCIAKTGDTPFQYIGIGNAAFVGGENTGEPFIIAHLPTFGMYCVLCADTNTHNVVVIGEKVVYHQIPDGYVPSDNYKVAFYMNADGTTSMANEWDDVVAAIEAGKNVYGEKVLSSVYSSGGECKTTMRLRFLYMKKNNNAYDDDKIAFESYIGTGIIVIRSYETGEITIGDDSQIPG